VDYNRLGMPRLQNYHRDRRAWAALAVLTMAAAAGGCARKKRVSVNPVPPVTAPAGWSETGVASWYGHPYHGRASASGEIYDMERLTAAHRTLPFHSWVRVYDLDNGKTVEVRINDRGPFVDGRVIDLSHAAASSIDMVRPGLAKVRLELIREPEGQAGPQFGVQVGVFQDRRNAERIRVDMEKRFGPTRLVERDGRPVMWRVLVGSQPSEQAAELLAVRIREGHRDARAAFVVRLDL
jgi:rare lipoprotein A